MSEADVPSSAPKTGENHVVKAGNELS